MLATLERPQASGHAAAARYGANAPPAPGIPSEAQELGRAVIQSVISGSGLTFTVDAPGAAAVTLFATPLRTWLLAARMASGGVSATVAPSFFGETYPAMLALVQSLERAGMGGMWRPEGVRTVRLESALHVFASADRPVAGRSPAPDTLLEVVDAHRTGYDWYSARVEPRTGAPGLTKVFYGLPHACRGSVFEQVCERSLEAEALDGTRRHFSLSSTAWLASALETGRSAA